MPTKTTRETLNESTVAEHVAAHLKHRTSQMQQTSHPMTAVVVVIRYIFEDYSENASTRPLQQFLISLNPDQKNRVLHSFSKHEGHVAPSEISAEKVCEIVNPVIEVWNETVLQKH